ncbi:MULTISPECIES: P68 family surface lipoprotein [unclassified Mycoplasma]
MPKLKKTKTILFALAAVTTPVVALTSASCNKTKSDFEIPERNRVVLATTYTPQSDLKRYSALVDLVTKYNEYVKKTNEEIKESSNPKQSLLKPVELQYFAGSLNDLYLNLKLKLNAKDVNTIPNAVLAYPSTAVLLSSYNKLLDLKNVDTSDIKDEFLKANSNLIGPKNIQVGLLPFGKSSEVMTVDLPLLGYILTTLNTKYDSYLKNLTQEQKVNLKTNLISATNSETLQKAINLWKSDSISENERNLIQELWKLDKANFDFSKVQNFTLDDSIIYTYDNQISFANFLANSLETNTNEFFVLGVDSVVNYLYLQMFNAAKGDFKNYYLQPGTKKNYLIDYWKVLNGSQNDTNSKEFYSRIKQIVDLINTKRFYVQRDSSRDFNSSRLQTAHKVLFGSGSTLAYNYVRFAQDPFFYKNQNISYWANGDLIKDQETTKMTIGSKIYMLPTDIDKKQKVVSLLNFDSNNKPTTASKTQILTENLISINKFMENANNAKVLYNSTEAKEFIINNLSDFVKFYVFDTSNPMTEEQYNSVYKTIDDINTAYASNLAVKDKLEKISELEKSLPKQVDSWWLLKDFKPQGNKLSLKNTLITTPPQKNNDEDPNYNGAYVLQGPSIVAIDAGQKNNASTLAFINWLYSDDFKQSWSDLKEGVELTPVEYFAYRAGYLFPSKNFIEQSPNLNTNAFLDIFIKQVQKTEQGDGQVPFEEPADKNSDKFRGTLKGLFNTTYASRDNQVQFSYQDFVKALKQTMDMVEERA